MEFKIPSTPGRGGVMVMWKIRRICPCPRSTLLHCKGVRHPLIQLLFLLLIQSVYASDMTPTEVRRVIRQAISRAEQIAPNAVIAVVDREGFVLGVWRVNNSRPKGLPDSLDFAVAELDAITKAGTAAFLSSNQNAFTSRTAGFIVQQHFPPNIQNRPNGPLVGVNFSNLEFTDVNRFKNPTLGHVPNKTSGVNGAAVAGFPFSALTGLAGSPGGVPLYRAGILIGGVGVAGQTIAPKVSDFSILADIQLQSQQKYDPDEDVALAGQMGFKPAASIFGSNVLIDGIRVPYVNSSTQLGTEKPIGTVGSNVLTYPIKKSPNVVYPVSDFGGQPCEIRSTIIADPEVGLINGQARLSAADVTRILDQASDRARITRAGIRLPRAKASQNFITVVSNPNTPNKPPVVLGTIRTPDATVFSWDVSAQKARTAVFFSNDTRAFSTRTVGFLSQQFYPPGIANTAPGPFYSLQEEYSLLPLDPLIVPLPPPREPLVFKVVNPLNAVIGRVPVPLPGTPPPPPNPNLPNGITIFPGGFPLYRNGVLVGGIGVSGDGIDQDDIIAAAGTVGFDAPVAIRADQQIYQGARLPYAKFPRNPDL